MFSLIVVFLIGRAFYDLARVYGKSEWAFAILGVISYYAGAFLFGGLLGALILLEFLVVEDLENLVFRFAELPAGLIAAWGTYALLKGNWKKKTRKVGDDTLDGDLLE